MKKLKNLILKNKVWALLFLLFALHIFFRFYQLEERAQFTWDQVDNAWVSKNMIINHQFPLLGMVARQDTGVFIGPAYYYLAAFFYLIFDLDPIASPILAGLTSMVSFFVLFYVTSKLFSWEISLMAVFLYAISFQIVNADRVQWPVNFIVPVSLLIFYFLYNVISGKVKYLIPLAVILGFSFHIHFTSVFYLPIILLSLPILFINRSNIRDRSSFLYLLFSIPFFLVWFVPHLVVQLNSTNPPTQNLFSFFQNATHGIHLRRIIQVAKDAFIEFDKFIFIPFLLPVKYFLPIIFAVIYIKGKLNKNRLILVYLMMLWFTLPWFSFSLYKGELSDYYFSLTRPLAVIILSYIIIRIFKIKNLLAKAIVTSILLYFFYQNMYQFLTSRPSQSLTFYKQRMMLEAKNTKIHQFTYGAAESYLFYYYRNKLYNDPW